MEKIFVGVLHMGISAGYLILAVLAVRFLLKKAPKTMRIFLWLLVGIRLLLPFSIESAFSLIPDTQSVNEQINNMEMPKQAGNTSSKAAPGLQSPLPAAETRAELPKTMVNATPLYLRFGTGIWIAGMIIMAVYMTISWIRLANCVKTAVPVDISVDETQKVRVYQSERIDSPFLFGIIRPRIYIPENLAEEDISYVVLHEKTHRERKDYLIKLAGFLILGVYWFHPLVWTAYIMLCRDIELICDEQVIRKLGEQCKKAYSQVLLASAAGHRMISACPVSFGEIGIRERVKNVLSYKKPAFWIVVVAVLACVAVPVCFMTQQKASALEQDVHSLAGIYEMRVPEGSLYVPELTLDEEGEFTFSYDVLSSYLSYGSYELSGSILTAVTSDGLYYYQFTLTDSGELVFNEEQSSKITQTDTRMGTAVRDGSVFVKREDNPEDTIMGVSETEETQNGSEPVNRNHEVLTDTLDLSSASTIEEWNVDDMIEKDAETLEALFPNHHDFALNNELTWNTDLDGDGVKEQIKLENLFYNGGDGGYALTVTDTQIGERIPLPDGYTEESGFPISANYTEPELDIGLGEDMSTGVITKIKGGALLRIYERKRLREEVKELMLKYNTFDSMIDAVSGCNVITREGEKTPTLVLKSYVSGTMGHSDTLGYIITEMKLQKDHTWNSKYYFLLDSCDEE